MRGKTLHSLPAGYHEVFYLLLTSRRNLLLMNLFSLPLLVLSVVGLLLWYMLIVVLRGPWQSEILLLPALLVLLVTIPLHELLHGLAIHWWGHQPRYGVKLRKMVFYCTTDGYFRRHEFLLVALAPLLVLTPAGLLLMLLLPQGMAFYIGLGVLLNTTGAVGDLWMAAVVLRYPSEAIIKDEEDSIRIFMPGGE